VPKPIFRNAGAPSISANSLCQGEFSIFEGFPRCFSGGTCVTIDPLCYHQAPSPDNAVRWLQKRHQIADLRNSE